MKRIIVLLVFFASMATSMIAMDPTRYPQQTTTDKVSEKVASIRKGIESCLKKDPYTTARNTDKLIKILDDLMEAEKQAAEVQAPETLANIQCQLLLMEKELHFIKNSNNCFSKLLTSINKTGFSLWFFSGIAIFSCLSLFTKTILSFYSDSSMLTNISTSLFLKNVPPVIFGLLVIGTLIYKMEH